MLESPGRLPKLSKSLPDWHSSGPRRITLSDHCLWTFPCTTIHHGAFPNICSSSDAFLLVNTVKTQYKSSSLCPHSYYGFWVDLWYAFVLEPISPSLVCVCVCFFKKKKKTSLYLVWIFFFLEKKYGKILIKIIDTKQLFLKYFNLFYNLSKWNLMFFFFFGVWNKFNVSLNP